MNLKSRKSEFLAFGFALLAVCAIAVHGQSGRRQPRPPSAAPVPTPTPEPTPVPKTPQKEAEIGFILGADSFSGFDSYPLSYYDAVLQGCADRLRSASSAHVTIAQDAMSRAEAIKKAKAETKTYVVNLKFVLDNMARSLDDLELQFTVFAPQTGKVVTFFSGYLGTNRKGPVIVGPRGSTGGALYREQLLQHAGADAAERILKALNLDVPVLH
jgi:hypothetical protein